MAVIYGCYITAIYNSHALFCGFSILISTILFPLQNSYSQNDGSNCAQRITKPPAAELCPKDVYKMEKAEMWFEFTANAPEHEVIVSPSETQPQAEITKLTLFENTCPDLHLRKEVSTQPPELPRMRMEQLIVGQKYIVKAEREQITTAANFEMCIIRDKVGGGGDGDGGDNGNGGTQTGGVECKGDNAAKNAWMENKTYPDKLFICNRYKFVGIGTDDPQFKLDVNGNIRGRFKMMADGNIETKGNLNASGNISTGGSVTATGNVTSSGSVTASGNISSSVDLVSARDVIASRFFKSGSSFYFSGGSDANTINTIYTNGKLMIANGAPGGSTSGYSQIRVGIGTMDPQKALHIKTIHNTGGGSHYGIRLEDNNETANKNSVWDIEPISGDKKPLFFKALDNDNVTKKVVLTMTNEGFVGVGTVDPKHKLDVNGDLWVSGKIIASGNIGAEFTGNVVASGYLKSGNSIIIAGGVTGGNNDNTIYSTTGNLIFGKGMPTNAPDFSNVRVGVGVMTAPIDASLTIQAMDISAGIVTPLKIYNSLNEPIFSIEEQLLPAGIGYGVTRITLGNITNNRTAETIINGNLEVNGSIMHVCSNQSCSVNLNNVFINDQNFHIKSNIGEDVNILLETKKGNIWTMFSKDDIITTHEWEMWGFLPVLVEVNTPVNYFGIHNSQTGETPFLIDPRYNVVKISDHLSVCGTITTGIVFVKNSWCDYVFNEDYNLMQLDKVKEFIVLNKHLPEIPSAKEVEKGGLNLGNMMEKMMKKIEEIFLYLFKHEDRLNNVEKELQIVKEENKVLTIQLNEQRQKLDSLILEISERE